MSSESREGSSSQGGTSVGDEDRCPVANYPIIARDELELGDQLGAGAYGSVYRGKWKTKGKEITVALKKVFMLEKEADILSKIRHRNIIQFFGVSQTNPDFFIVTEFADGGSLYDYVHRAVDTEIDFNQIISWALQIASGVAYLHYEAPETIIHRDLKSKNVVLTGELICKLCDFGTSKNLTHSWTAPSWGGTAAWMSPEIINQKEGITTATDVWSYAVVLWEIISREVPYKGLTEFRIYSMIAQQGVTLVISEKCPSALSSLMKSCWKVNPKERPDMRQIIIVLESLQHNTELSEQCGHFLKHKHEWKCEIEEQLRQLEEQKIDYAKKLEELDRREQALKRREKSQRENDATARALQGDVALWDEEEVCQWMRQISASLSIEGDVLDHFIALILHHNINGNRLLDITPKDLESLGICSLGIRHNLFKEVKNLRRENYRLRNFPSLQVSQQLGHKKKQEKLSQPLSLPLIIHVTMYTRQSGFDYFPKFRYKILIDVDWDDCCLGDDVPIDLHDSHVVIKNVYISILSDDKTVAREPYRCDSYPYTVSEWIDSPTSGGEIEVVCALSYTDRVIRPRSTCIRTKLFDFSRAQTLENKRLELLVRSHPLASNLSRRESGVSLDRQSFKNQSSADSGVGVSNTLQGVWRNRVSTTIIIPSELSDGSSSIISTPRSASKSPLWSDIAAGILNSQSLSPAYPNDATLSPYVSASVPGKKGIDVAQQQSPLRWPKSTGDGDGLLHTEDLVRDSLFVTPLPKLSRDGLQQRLCRTQSSQQMASRKLSGTMARGRRRPIPIILPRRKFSSSFRRETLSTDVEETQAPINTPVALTGDVLLKEISEYSTGAFASLPNVKREDGGQRVVLNEHSRSVTSELGGNENEMEKMKKGRRRHRHRPHKKASKLEQKEQCSDTESASTSLSNCTVSDITKSGTEAKRQAVHGGYQKWCWK